MVWTDRTPGNNNIFFAVSNDNGQTFSAPHNLSNSTTGASEPQISSSGNNVYVVWREQVPAGPNFFAPDIFFAFSTHNGKTFSNPDNLSENDGSSEDPQISSEGNNVYVVWVDDTLGNEDNIFYTTNNQDFGLFGTPLNLGHFIEFPDNPQISSST